MEEKVFHRPAVAEELAGFVEARLHTDGRKNIEEIRRLQRELTKSVANPFYVTIDPSSGEKLEVFPRATLFDDQPFIDFLKLSLEKAGKVAVLAPGNRR